MINGSHDMGFCRRRCHWSENWFRRVRYVISFVLMYISTFTHWSISIDCRQIYSWQWSIHDGIIARRVVAGLHMMTSSNGNIFRVTGHLCGKFTIPGELPAQRPVMRSFHVYIYIYMRLNKRLSKQSWGWWFETLSRPLWRHRNDLKKK